MRTQHRNQTTRIDYEWEKSADGGTTWVSDLASTDKTITLVDVDPNDDDVWYRCRVMVADRRDSSVIQELRTAGAMVTVVTDEIFSDGFESGDVSRSS